MKTLDQVEPRRPLPFVATGNVIIEPGSYYLVTDKVPAILGGGGAGITIASDDVTLDLNGFSVRSAGSSFQWAAGIVIQGTRRNIVIHNGAVTGSAGAGIATDNTASNFINNSRFERLHLANNGGVGLYAGAKCIVKDLTAESNGGRGVQVLNHSIVSGVSASTNGDTGIVVGDFSAIRDCASSDNGGDGYFLDGGASASRCTATSNAGRGYDTALQGVALADCTAANNGSHGFELSGNATLTNCIAENNTGRGFWTSDGVALQNCTANNNTDTGFYIAGRSVLTNCAALFNDVSGFRLTTGGSSLKGCSATNNGEHGIHVTSNDNQVIECVSRGNGSAISDGAGVRVEGSQNRIEGCTLNSNDFGLRVESGAANLIVKNFAAGNPSEYSIIAGQFVGTIQTGAVGVGPWDNVRD